MISFKIIVIFQDILYILWNRKYNYNIISLVLNQLLKLYEKNKNNNNENIFWYIYNIIYIFIFGGSGSSAFLSLCYDNTKSHLLLDLLMEILEYILLQIMENIKNLKNTNKVIHLNISKLLLR